MRPASLRRFPARRIGVPLVLLVLLGAGLLPVPARAAKYTWVNALGGNAGNPVNWNPAVRPGALDTLTFDLGGTYGVTFGVNVPATNRILVPKGTVSFDFGVPHRQSGELQVGTDPASTAILDFISGADSLSGPLLVGSGLGTGTFRITGSGTDVWHTSPTLIEIGKTSGTGTMNVRDGGAFTTTALIQVGSGSATGVGTLKVTGDAATPIARRATFTALPSAIDQLRVGHPGVGAVEVRNGALLDVQRTMVLGGLAGSSGTLLAAGSGALDSARVTIGGNLHIGRALDGVAGGTGAVTADTRGVIEVADTTFTYDDAGTGGGTITVNGGGRFATRSLFTDSPSTDLVLNGGKLQVVGGTLDTKGASLTLNSTTGSPTVELLDGATATITGTSAYGVNVGSNGSARLNIRNGSTLRSDVWPVVIGSSIGSDGTLLVDGGTLWTSEDLIAGSSGTGALNVRDGGVVHAGGLYVSRTASGTGSVLVTGPGAVVNVTGSLHMSGTSAAEVLTPSTLTVEDGGVFDIANTGPAGFIWSEATLAVNPGGTFTLGGSIYLDGAIQMNGGVVNGGTFTMRGTGSISGAGDFNAALATVSDTTTRIEATGDLQIGRSDLAAGLEFGGRMLVNDATVTLRDADSARVGNTWLGGGTLQGPPGGTVLLNIYKLTGSGRVEGTFRNRGTIAADAAPGLGFAGTLESYGRPVSGTLRVLPGGSFVGNGSLSGSVFVDSGAVMTNVGALILGSTLGTSALDFRGLLACGISPVTCYVADTVRVGGELRLGGGTFSVILSRPLLIRSGGALTGTGTVATSVVGDGRISPGDPASSRFSTITLGQFTARSGGTLEIEIGTPSLGQADRLVATTRADLGGTLDVRRVGFFVNPGDSVQILSTPQLAGTFANVTLDGGPVYGGLFEVHYDSDGVWLVFPHGVLDVPGPPAAGRARVLAFAPLGSPGRAPALELSLPGACEATIELLDLSGRRLATLTDGPLAAGVHRFAPREDQLPAAQVCFARARITGPAGIERRVVRLLRLR